MVKNNQPALAVKPLSIYSLYDDYAAMLLGYIYEVVRDKKVAEDYLIKTFSSLAQKFNDISWGEHNRWCQLQQIARNELAAYAQPTQNDNKSGASAFKLPVKYLDKMTEEQKLVFCSIYYRKKTTAQLAAEINKSEELVKRLLKEAFTLIRKSNGN